MAGRAALGRLLAQCARGAPGAAASCSGRGQGAAAALGDATRARAGALPCAASAASAAAQWRAFVSRAGRDAPLASPALPAAAARAPPLLRGFAAHATPARAAVRAPVAPTPPASRPHTTNLRAAQGFSTTAAASAAVPTAAPFAHALVTSPAAQRAVGAWLFGGAAWVFSMVVLGGVTRLTRSGLSMTDWRFTGEAAPRTPAEWDAEFAKYRDSPEYQKVNRGMSLAEFQDIYWMEYTHRMWGRYLGVYFALPLTYFAARGYVTAALGRRLALLFAAGGSQGLVGWWMVKSGLEQPRSEHEVRLASCFVVRMRAASC